VRLQEDRKRPRSWRGRWSPRKSCRGKKGTGGTVEAQQAAEADVLAAFLVDGKADRERLLRAGDSAA
jgi:hypothetical protein